METVVELPNNPYFCTLNFQPGEKITIAATVLREAEGVNVSFICDEGPIANLGLFIAMDFKGDEVIVNSKLSNEWDNNTKHHGLCFKQVPDLEIVIQCTHNIYQVSMNGAKIGEYFHEIPRYNITHMTICGDIDIKKIMYLSAKKLIPTEEILPPDYETVNRNGCGSVDIPINLKREVTTLSPTIVPLVPVGSEIRRVAEISDAFYSTYYH